MSQLLIIPQAWEQGPAAPPDSFLAGRSPALLRVWPQADEALARASRLVSYKLLATRMELEQGALSYAWDGTSHHYADLGRMPEARRETLREQGVRVDLVANDRDLWKLHYLCGCDKTDDGPRPDGWFGPELQLLGCGARFRFLYRGKSLPADLAAELPPLPEALRGMGESDLYAPGVPVTRGATTMTPANQASADCLRYTSSLDAQARLRGLGTAWWPDDYRGEDERPVSKVLKVFVDAGHGSLNADGKRDTGTAGGGLPEHEANLEVALRLEALLLAQGHEVILSRRNCDWTRRLSPGDRGRLSAAEKADVFVSIHHDGSVKPEANGCHGFYHDERAQKGKVLATALAEALHAEFKAEGLAYSYGAPSSDWFGNELGVLSGGDNWAVTDYAALVECMYMTNAHDLAIIKSSGYYDRAARAIACAIHTATGIPVPDEWKPASPITPVLDDDPDWDRLGVVRLGSEGAGASTLQEGLVRAGYAIAVDGVVGPKTVEALKAFQAARGLEADGVCGPLTWAAIRAVWEGVEPGPEPDDPVEPVPDADLIAWAQARGIDANRLDDPATRREVLAALKAAS